MTINAPERCNYNICQQGLLDKPLTLAWINKEDVFVVMICHET